MNQEFLIGIIVVLVIIMITMFYITNRNKKKDITILAQSDNNNTTSQQSTPDENVESFNSLHNYDVEKDIEEIRNLQELYINSL